MLRTLLRALFALTILLTSIPAAAHADGPAPGALVQDTTLIVTSTDTVPPPADSVAQGVVLPKNCSGLACVKEFVVTNQMYLAMGLTSLLLFLFAKYWPGFAGISDWATIVVQLGIGWLISYFVTSWGGSPDAALNALITTSLSALLSGYIFTRGKKQPGNALSFRR